MSSSCSEDEDDDSDGSQSENHSTSSESDARSDDEDEESDDDKDGGLGDLGGLGGGVGEKHAAVKEVASPPAVVEKTSEFSVSDSTKSALTRLVNSINDIEDETAPLGSRNSLTAAKKAIENCEALKKLKSIDTNKINEESFNELLCGVAMAANSLAAASSSVQSVDVEIEAFRRLTYQIYNVWEDTLPAMERLDCAISKANESAAHASRIASEMITTQLTLAKTVTRTLEGLIQRSSCENGGDTPQTTWGGSQRRSPVDWVDLADS